MLIPNHFNCRNELGERARHDCSMRGCISDANDTNLTDTLGHGKLDYSLCCAAVALRGWQSAALQDRGRSDVADVAAPARVPLLENVADVYTGNLKPPLQIWFQCRPPLQIC